MNATETEIRIANDMVEFLEEYVRQQRCDPVAVTVLFIGRMFSQQLQDILPGAGS